MNAGATRGHYGKPKLVNPERAMESTRNREAEILTADGTDKRGSGTFQMRALRAATAEAQTRRGGAVRGQHEEPKLMDPERAMEWGNVRLCSLMFAYVRFIGEKCLSTCADSFL